MSLIDSLSNYFFVDSVKLQTHSARFPIRRKTEKKKTFLKSWDRHQKHLKIITSFSVVFFTHRWQCASPCESAHSDMGENGEDITSNKLETPRKNKLSLSLSSSTSHFLFSLSFFVFFCSKDPVLCCKNRATARLVKYIINPEYRDPYVGRRSSGRNATMRLFKIKIYIETYAGLWSAISWCKLYIHLCQSVAIVNVACSNTVILLPILSAIN